MSDPLPPPAKPEKKESGTISLRPSVWLKLQTIADDSLREDPKKVGYSRNGVIEAFIDWAISEYERDRALKRKK